MHISDAVKVFFYPASKDMLVSGTLEQTPILVFWLMFVECTSFRCSEWRWLRGRKIKILGCDAPAFVSEANSIVNMLPCGLPTWQETNVIIFSRD